MENPLSLRDESELAINDPPARSATCTPGIAPVTLNVVLFRYAPAGVPDDALDRLNANLAIALQESGEAVPSTTRLGGRLALRACFVNHRTRAEDVDLLLAAVRRHGRREAGVR